MYFIVQSCEKSYLRNNMDKQRNKARAVKNPSKHLFRVAFHLFYLRLNVYYLPATSGERPFVTYL